MPPVPPFKGSVWFGRDHRNVLAGHRVRAITEKLPDAIPQERMATGMMVLLLAQIETH